MISLILQAIRQPMPSNLCGRSQQFKLKKVFFYDWGKPMVNQFINNRIWEIIAHTLSLPKHSSDYFSTKGSITSLKSRTWKTRNFLRSNATYEVKTNYCLLSHTRATQSSNFFSKATVFFEQLFDKLNCHVCCTYAVITSAHRQEEKLPFRQGN